MKVNVRILDEELNEVNNLGEVEIKDVVVDTLSLNSVGKNYTNWATKEESELTIFIDEDKINNMVGNDTWWTVLQVEDIQKEGCWVTACSKIIIEELYSEYYILFEGKDIERYRTVQQSTNIREDGQINSKAFSILYNKMLQNKHENIGKVYRHKEEYYVCLSVNNNAETFIVLDNNPTDVSANAFNIIDISSYELGDVASNTEYIGIVENKVLEKLLISFINIVNR